MKKLTVYAIVALVIIAAIVAVIILMLSQKPGDPEPAAAPEPVASDVSNRELTEYAKDIMRCIVSGDYASLGAVSHPEYGVVFSPYATIDLNANRRFTASQVAELGRDTQEYIWGIYSGTADPIRLTPTEYFKRFVWDADYLQADKIRINRITAKGNALENIDEVFPDARYADFYIAPTNGSDGTDWHSLRLVFEDWEGKLMLSAVVHSEYTI